MRDPHICLLLFYTAGGMDTGFGSVPNPTAITLIPLIPMLAPSTIMVDVIPSVPSITTLLATPLPPLSGSQPTPAASPLTLSSALPPIPGKLVERIQSRVYIDFKEFLSDNVMLLQRLRELNQGRAVPASVQPLVDSSCLHEILDLLSWDSCFLAFYGGPGGPPGDERVGSIWIDCVATGQKTCRRWVACL